MKNEKELPWEEIYHLWQLAMTKYPELKDPNLCQRRLFSEPRFGPIYHFNWVNKNNMEAAIQEDLRILASAWPEIGSQWSKGTIMTAALLASCETEEELAAVWLSAFARSWLGRGYPTNTTEHNLSNISEKARFVFAPRYGYWHHNSSDLFPEEYISRYLLYSCDELSAMSIVDLAAANASLVMTHYTPVEYEMAK